MRASIESPVQKWALGCFLTMALAVSTAGANSENEIQKQSLAEYARAVELYGVALGERDDPDDPANSMLMGRVAELLCLQGQRDGCLEASRQAKRELGPYAESVAGAVGFAPGSYAAGRSFVSELHAVSSGWGKDGALASEAMALLAQLEADHHRRRARDSARARYQKTLKQARRKPTLEAWLQAGRLAWVMLDQEAVCESGLGLAGLVVDRGAEQDLTAKAERIVAQLRRSRDMWFILGRSAGEESKRIEKALELLKSSAVAAAELDFGLAPAAEGFKTDLDEAHNQLLKLADKAPLRSRASELLHFFAAYAGVIAGEPGAAGPLADLLESLSLTDPYLALRCRGLLGRDFLLAGDYHRAAGSLGRSAAGLPKTERFRSLRGLLLANRAQALFFLGRYRESADVFDSVSVQLSNRPVDGFQALIGKSHGLAFAGDLDGAEKALEVATELLETLPVDRRPALERTLRLDEALIDIRAGRTDRAITRLEKIAAGALQAGDVKAGGVARTNLAELLNDRGDARAFSQAQAALKWLDPASQADVVWQARLEKGRAHVIRGDLEAARREFRIAMELVERLRARIGAEGSRRTFSAAKARLYQAAVSLEVLTGRLEEAFWISERARGRAFLDMLGERRIELGNAARQKKMGPARDRMLRALPALALGFGEPGNSLAARVSKASSPRAKAMKADPRQGWLSLVTVNPARVSDVKRVLGRKEALLSFYHDGVRLHGLLVTKKGVRVGSVEIEPRQLTNRVDEFLGSLRQPKRTDRKVRKRSARLHKATFHELSAELKSIDRLVIVPWGPLHYVPFGAFWDGEHYLIDTHELTVVPSASALVMIRSGKAYRRKLKRPSVLALGNPKTDMDDLPAAEREAKLLGKLFKGAEVHLGPKATKRAFVASAGRHRLVHLASHGVFLPERPMDSYLALAGVSPKQGRLPALEVLGLDLSSARLVMLSACSSGEARVEQGDEVVGLSRAFLHAGTPALVASLWPLGDQGTLELVQRLYAGVRKGLSPSAALTRASRALKAEEEYSHPFYWAPFVLIGSLRSLVAYPVLAF